jgi:hypothetical protein
MEQPHAKTRFQRGHGMAERRGGHAQFICRRPKAAMARHRQHRFKFSQTRGFHCPILLNRTSRIVRLVNAIGAAYLVIETTRYRRIAGHIMQIIDKIYLDGAFVEPHGTEWFDLFNPATDR